MNRLVLAIITIIVVLLSQPAPAYYVAPYGVVANGGDADAPRTLAWALASAPAGSTVWLISGTYTGDFRALAAGVTYRSLPGTRAKIDGSLRVSASDVTVQGLEIFSSAWPNRTASNGSVFEVITPGFSVPITGVRVIDNWIHDVSEVTDWATSRASLWQNNLIYNIGWQGHGHALYTQNQAGAMKRFQHNVFANSYGLATQAYGSLNASIDDFAFENNVYLNSRFLLGGGKGAHNAHILNNRFWKAQLQLGYAGTPNENITIENNWIGQARIQAARFVTGTVRLNRFAADNDTNATLIPPKGAGVAWDANQYWHPTNGSPFNVDGVGFKSYPQWQAYTGWDATSVYTGTLPTSNWIEITPAGANHGRAVVYNWTQSPTVTLDLAPLSLTPGASYRLVNAQNPAEWQAFVAGTPVPLPMSGWTVAKPIGASAPLYAWDNRFSVWLVAP